MRIKTSVASGLALAMFATVAAAQQPAPTATPGPFRVGTPLSSVNEAGVLTPMTTNVKVYGSFRFAESCTFDPSRNLILALNAGIAQNLAPNDAFVSLINPDGSVNTSKWIGVNRDGLTLNQTLGSAIQGDLYYANDTDTVRTFDLATGQPRNAFKVPEAVGLNGIAVSSDGTIYTSNTGNPQRIYKITATGDISTFVDGDPLVAPNGLAIDPDGNIVEVNTGNNNVLTFDTSGKLIKTEQSVEGGNDGLVVLPDGTKYTSSVRFGSVSRIRPGQPAEEIAAGIPSAASMCYDSIQNQLIIPMNDNNSLAFISLN